jgi:hypothetical protein
MNLLPAFAAGKTPLHSSAGRVLRPAGMGLIGQGDCVFGGNRSPSRQGKALCDCSDQDRSSIRFAKESMLRTILAADYDKASRQPCMSSDRIIPWLAARISDVADKLAPNTIHCFPRVHIVIDARTALSRLALLGFELRHFAIEAQVRWMIADNGEPSARSLSARHCQSAGTGSSRSKKRGGFRYLNAPPAKPHQRALPGFSVSVPIYTFEKEAGLGPSRRASDRAPLLWPKSANPTVSPFLPSS